MTHGDPVATRIGPYRVLSALGRGGMGVVYEAFHESTGERAAVKTVTVPDPELLAALRREIQALARLRHPGIVRILAEGVEGGMPWYAMERVPGVTLRGRLVEIARRPGGAPEPAALDGLVAIFRRLCAPLAFLHGEGIVHRDVKPDNVLVRPDGSAVLVDFGLIAELRGEGRRDLLAVGARSSGTLAFMAPEQVRGGTVDARADLYALGVVLFLALTGALPFARAEDAADPDRAAPPPSRVAPGVPPAMDEVVARLLAKDPRARFGYAADVARALRVALEMEPAEPEGPAPRSYLYRPALAGRSALRDALASHLRRVAGERRFEAILVGGESGIGKTRLAVEIAAMLEGGFRSVACAAAAPAGEGAVPGEPLATFRPVLAAVADACREGGLEATEAILGPRGRVLVPYAPEFAGLPGQAAHPEPPKLPSRDAAERLHRALGDTLAALAARTPLLILVDDLQWADELSLGFLAHVLARGPEGGACAVLATYRIDEVGPPLERILALAPRSAILGRLDAAAIGAMAADMMAADPPPGFAAHLAERSEGNPFFVAEYLHAAVDEGLLGRDGAGRWRVEGVPADAAEEYDRLPLPPGIRDLVGRRLRGLPPEAARAADGAAVLGRVVEAADLGPVVEMEGAELSAGIKELLRRHVLEDAAPGVLRFTHDRLREGAYGALAAPLREALHARAASALEARGAEPAVLGLHRELGGDPAGARPLYLAAARGASSRHAHAESERLYRSYLRVTARPDRESVEARNELGRKLHLMLGKHVEARECHLAAVRDARALGDRGAEASALRFHADVHDTPEEMERAIMTYGEALAIARELGDRALEGEILAGRAGLLGDLGRRDEAVALFEEALAIQRGTAPPDTVAVVVGNLGHMLLDRGEHDAAHARYREALSLYRAAGDVRGEALVLGYLANTPLPGTAVAARRETFARALALVRRAGDRRNEGLLLANLAMLEGSDGHLEEALALYERAVAIQRAVGEARILAWVGLQHASAVLRRLGRYDDAARQMEEALAAPLNPGDIIAAFRAMEAAHVALARGLPARDLLAEVQRVVDLMGAGGGPIGAQAARLAEEVAAAESGTPLRHGELPAEGA